MSISHFTAPVWLAFLLVVGLLALGYVLAQRRRHKHMLRFANMAVLEKVAPTRPSASRHVPMALLLAGLVLFTVAAAGPTSVQKVPRNRATVILVMDVSLSMEAQDVPPSRLQVAQEAATEFAEGLTPGINLGLVTYAGTASVQVSPTTDRDSVAHAIGKLKLSERTATGEGIYSALQSIDTLGAVLGGSSEAPPARIVLMSDGKQTVPDFDDIDNPRHEFVAARQAKNKNVPVSTISFGTQWGVVEIEREDGGTERVPVPVDDDALKEIADLSGGEFYQASTLEELTGVYDTLEEQIGYETKRGDASRPWVLLGLVVVTAAAAASLLLRQRLP